MKVALALLGIGAVTFLLSVLAALVNEWARFRRSEIGHDVARLDLSRQRGELIEMNSAVRNQIRRPGTGARMAL